MSVTEFALIRLRDDYDKLELLEVVMQCQEIQDEWVRHNQPHALHRSHTDTLSSMYIQEDDSSHHLLITAIWDSPEAHREWIKSKDNITAFGRLAAFIAPGYDSTLFHIDTAGEPEQLRGEFLAREQFHVYRLFKTGSRDAIAREYRDLEGQIHEKSPQQLLWGGWRIEKHSDDEEELVVFRCKDVPAERMDALLALADGTEMFKFQHIVL
jgi:hypothetical protein